MKWKIGLTHNPSIDISWLTIIIKIHILKYAQFSHQMCISSDLSIHSVWSVSICLNSIFHLCDEVLMNINVAGFYFKLNDHDISGKMKP